MHIFMGKLFASIHTAQYILLAKEEINYMQMFADVCKVAH